MEKIEYRICKQCNIEKSIFEFRAKNISKQIYSHVCKNCRNENEREKYKENPGIKERMLKNGKKWRENNPEKTKEITKKFYQNNKEREKLRTATFKIEHPKEYLLIRAKSNAKRQCYEFNITLEDIIIPEFCPILGIELYFIPGKRTEHSPSLDRVDNNKGYIKGNVRVISNKANCMKRDLTRDMALKIIDYIDGKI